MRGVVGEVGLLDHVDQRLADVDRVDAVALDVVRQRVVERLHDEAGRDAATCLRASCRRAAPATSSFFGPALLDDLFAVVELELGHQVALSVGSRRERIANIEAISSVCGATCARKSELRMIFW